LRFIRRAGIFVAVKRGRKPNAPVAEEKLACAGIVRLVQHHRERLVDAVHPRHGNVRLDLTDALVVMLAAFFNPAVRSLRLIEQLSQIPWINGQLRVDRVCRSTLSDAFERFEPEQLLPIIEALAQQVPQLARVDGDLESLCRRVVAGDGSYWNIPADVLWALAQNRGGKGKTPTRRAVRVNWQFDVSSFTPTADVSVSGADEGSEAAAFIKRLVEGVIYVVDRNFVHFDFINAVLAKNSDLVLRLRSDTRFEATRTLALCEKDLAAGVVSDRLGTLPGSSQKKGKSRTGHPPTRMLREVIITDPQTGKSVRLITSLLDVPAHVIGAIYRNRWQIELFFRWLKVWANFDHLFSHGKKGITLQFYVAIIACLLMYVRSGRKLNRYGLFLLGEVAAGRIAFDAIVPMLDRIEREKQLERERRLRKKAASAKKVALLPA
jgi:hypothetical protein